MSDDRRVFVVTGASGAIGSAVVRALVEDGGEVVACGRDPEKLERRLAAAGRPESTLALAGDLNDEEYAASIVERSIAWRGRIDGLVLCAGEARFTFFERLTPEEFESAWRLNFCAPVDLVRSLLPYLQESPRGRIALINSIVAREPTPPRGTAYIAAKAALLHFAEGLFAEIRDTGVSVTSVLPDLVDTPMVPDAAGYDPTSLLSAESVADAVVFAFASRTDACVTEIHLRPQPSLRRRGD